MRNVVVHDLSRRLEAIAREAARELEVDAAPALNAAPALDDPELAAAIAVLARRLELPARTVRRAVAEALADARAREASAQCAVQEASR